METPSICWMTKEFVTPCRIRQRIPSGILPTPYLRTEITGKGLRWPSPGADDQRIGQDLGWRQLLHGLGSHGDGEYILTGRIVTMTSEAAFFDGGS
ncbi:MAG: hypothetical protein Ct9H90mP16_18600 [Candidatus Poseidoniales archaeon]|nr:MAG: hypothetical protein Ct9H90mP16_18600 [Candidatus Poseidoniales archaeon]